MINDQNLIKQFNIKSFKFIYSPKGGRKIIAFFESYRDMKHTLNKPAFRILENDFKWKDDNYKSKRNRFTSRKDDDKKFRGVDLINKIVVRIRNLIKLVNLREKRILLKKKEEFFII